MDKFTQDVQDKGFKVGVMKMGGSAFGVIYNDEESLSLPFHFFTKEGEEGVWISDIEQYKALMRLK